MALRGEIVDFVGLNFLHDADQVRGIGQIAIMQEEIADLLMRVLIEMIDASVLNDEERRFTPCTT